MKCVLLLVSVVVLLCGVYSIHKRSPLSETKNLKYISRPRASALLKGDLETAASYDNWHHTITKHIHSHKHEHDHEKHKLKHKHEHHHWHWRDHHHKHKNDHHHDTHGHEKHKGKHDHHHKSSHWEDHKHKHKEDHWDHRDHWEHSQSEAKHKKAHW